ncbi:hypothetical protein [Kribbella solani]|uniref:DUF8175 domain-containing protein n=1 Tax=Kribbella solani TaxID=236067 RepID=A0A841DYG6_9ACTN|nr:hypothetical protein [Kribbella solani]MBB5981810.1 hypothetical protein [Kribbella solani]
MRDTSEQSPYGRGFIAACIVVAAVILCAATLLIANLTSAEPTAVETTPGAGAAPPADPATPADPVGAIGSAETGRRSSGCQLPGGDQAIPSKAPTVDSWEVSRRIVVPRSTTNGPATTDPDGFRRCFAHSPTGAVYAAYNAYAAIADQSVIVSTARKLMLPGPATDALIRKVQAQNSTSGYTTPQLSGYRIIDAGQERVSLMLAMPVESAYMSLNFTLVWHDNDWRLQPPAGDEPVGAPYAQHRDLSGFVAWSGV